MKLFKTIKCHFIKYKIYIILFILFSAITWGTSIIVPYLLGNYIDELTINKNEGVVYNFLKLVITFAVIDIITSYYRDIIMVKIKTRISFDVIYDTIEHVKKLPLSYFHGTDAAYLNQKINSDANTVVNFVLDNFISIIFKVLTLLVVLVLIFKINIIMFIIILSIIPINIISYALFKRSLYNKGYNFREAQSKFFSKINEQLYIIKLIKMNYWFTPLAKDIKKTFNVLFKKSIEYAKTVYYFNNSNTVIRYISTITLILFGGFQIINNRLTVGKFTILNSYFSMVLGCISYFLNFSKSYQDTLVSYNRLKEINDVQEEHNGQECINSIESIKLDNINFSYMPNENIINNFSYEFQKGKIYSILGRNGIGKSTLIDIIMGLRYNYSGTVYYNNIDINELDMYSIRENLIGVVEQEPVLLKDTIENNLTYGLKSYDKESLVNYCKYFDVFKLAYECSDTDYKVTENNSNISGGEKQKISQIRALIKNPDVLILDEPISALDKNSIKALKRILTNMKEHKIIILITHNMEILDIVDETLDLSNLKCKAI